MNTLKLEKLLELNHLKKILSKKNVFSELTNIFVKVSHHKVIAITKDKTAYIEFSVKFLKKIKLL